MENCQIASYRSIWWEFPNVLFLLVQPALCQLSSADVKKLKKKTEDLIMMIHEGFDNQVQSELIIKPEEVPIDCITGERALSNTWLNTYDT